MPGRCACGVRGGCAQAETASGVQARGRVGGQVPELIGFFLLPGERAFCAKDANAQVVFAADFNLRGDQNAACAALVAQQQVTIVVESATGNKGGEVGAQRFDFMCLRYGF